MTGTKDVEKKIEKLFDKFDPDWKEGRNWFVFKNNIIKAVLADRKTMEGKLKESERMSECRYKLIGKRENEVADQKRKIEELEKLAIAGEGETHYYFKDKCKALEDDLMICKGNHDLAKHVIGELEAENKRLKKATGGGT